MKILYLDLGMGAAGDMLTAALLDSMNEKDKTEAIKEISLLGSCGDQEGRSGSDEVLLGTSVFPSSVH